MGEKSRKITLSFKGTHQVALKRKRKLSRVWRNRSKTKTVWSQIMQTKTIKMIFMAVKIASMTYRLSYNAVPKLRSSLSMTTPSILFHSRWSSKTTLRRSARWQRMDRSRWTCTSRILSKRAATSDTDWFSQTSTCQLWMDFKLLGLWGNSTIKLWSTIVNYPY